VVVAVECVRDKEVACEGVCLDSESKRTCEGEPNREYRADGGRRNERMLLIWAESRRGDGRGRPWVSATEGPSPGQAQTDSRRAPAVGDDWCWFRTGAAIDELLSTLVLDPQSFHVSVR